MTEPALFIVMRNDIPSMNPGKLAAQAAHVGNAAVAYAKKHRRALLLKWEHQTKQHFGTTLVFGAPKVWFSAVPADQRVYDPTYPCAVPNEIAGLLAGKVTGCSVIFSSTGQAIFLRRELVGAFFLAEAKPAALHELDLYP